MKISKNDILIFSILSAIFFNYLKTKKMEMESKKPNRLINEDSLYLRQHAYNPIDWYPWSEEAFETAKKRDCPIFLSIGYSSCHWCHVMEKESFENEEIAQILNENFVSIKVDREELPDIDNFYMTFVQASTGNGGWPLSVFLLPDKTPFFGGTYFPPEPKFGKPAFKSVLISVLETYKTRRDELEKLKVEVKSFLEKSFIQTNQSQEYDFQKIKDAYQIIVKNYDWENGGWGKGAKFPMFSLLNFLMDYYLVYKDNYAKKIIEHNLTKILMGGIYDHIAGGMHRYTVDNQWIIPHFEKMLYDNAQLIESIAKYLIIESNEFFKEKLYQTFEFLQSEMKSKYGAYFTSIDADSEGIEGKFYLWNYYELIDAVEEKFDKDLFFEFFQINLIEKERAAGNLSLRNIPNYDDPLQINELVLITKHLNEKRNNRIKPDVDNKILTDLNSLLIKALTYAYRATEDSSFLNEAKSIFNFIEKFLLRENQLYHTFIEGKARVNGLAEDYFSLIEALIHLYETTFEEYYLNKSYQLIRHSLNEFYDDELKIIFQQSKSVDTMVKTSENKDYSKPSSTSTAIFDLLKLGKIFEDKSLIEIGKNLLTSNFNEVINAPFGGGKFLSNVFLLQIPPKELILVEGDDNGEFNRFNSYLMKQIFPNQMVLFLRKNASFKFSYLEGKMPIDNKLTLYYCENFTCLKPINNSETLVGTL